MASRSSRRSSATTRSRAERAASTSAGAASRSPNCSLVNMEPFWTDPTVIGDVKAHIAALLDHVNVYTHVAYKNDPTILGWDLLNGGGSPTGVDARDRHASSAASTRRHLILSGAVERRPRRRRRLRQLRLSALAHAARLREAVDRARCDAHGQAVPRLRVRLGPRRTIRRCAALASVPRLARAEPRGRRRRVLGARRRTTTGTAGCRSRPTSPTRSRAARSRAASGGRSTTRGSATLVNTAADMAARAQVLPPPQLRDARHAGAGARRPAAADGHLSRLRAPGLGARLLARVGRRARLQRRSEPPRAGGPWLTRLPALRHRSQRRLRRPAAAAKDGWYRVVPYNLDGKPGAPSRPRQAAAN